MTLFPGWQSPHNEAAVENIEELSSRDDKSSTLSPENNHEKIKERFKEFVSKSPLKKPTEQFNVFNSTLPRDPAEASRVFELCNAAIHKTRGTDLIIVIGKTGASGESYTFVPKIIPIPVGDKDDKISLCELPDFNILSIEQKVMAANAVHMVTQVCGKIKAIAVLSHMEVLLVMIGLLFDMLLLHFQHY